MTQQEIIPRVYGVNDAYTKLPMDVGFIAMAGGGPVGAQFLVSGSGAGMPWGSARSTRSSAARAIPTSAFSGCSAKNTGCATIRRRVGLTLGDKVYSLTNLTNLEIRPRAEARLSFGDWSVRGFAAKSLFMASPIPTGPFSSASPRRRPFH